MEVSSGKVLIEDCVACINKRSKDHTPRAPEAFWTQMVLVGVASFNRKRLDLDW